MSFAAECGHPDGIAIVLRSAKDETSQAFQIRSTFAIIGTSDHCNIRISDRSILPEHAYVQVLGDQVFVCSFSERQPVTCNSRSVNADWFDINQEFELGDFQMRVLPDKGFRSLDTSESRPMIVARVGGDDSSGRLIWSDKDVSLAGRASACMFQVKSSSVSNIHCSIVRTPFSAWVIDLSGHRGTYIDGGPIQLACLPPECTLKVGRFELRIEVRHTDETKSSATSLIPVSSPKHSGSIPTRLEPDQDLVRDLIAELSESQRHAQEHARQLISDVLASQERMHAERTDAMQHQIDQLLDVIKIMAQGQASPVPNVEGPSNEEPAVESGNANESPVEVPGNEKPDKQSMAEERIDPEARDVWVRSQLHTISEQLRKDQQTGLQRMLRKLFGGNDDALR